MLAEVSWLPEERPFTFVCGPALLAVVAVAPVKLGHDPAREDRTLRSNRRLERWANIGWTATLRRASLKGVEYLQIEEFAAS
jgi:hypothetical protein